LETVAIEGHYCQSTHKSKFSAKCARKASNQLDLKLFKQRIVHFQSVIFRESEGKMPFFGAKKHPALEGVFFKFIV
jgi:hypothetical protein